MIVITLLVGILFWIGIDIWAGITSKWYKAVELDSSIISEDFSVLVPIYGNVKYLQNADYLRPYGDRVVLCTTSGESEEFYRDLEDIAIRYGFRIFRSEYVPRKVGRKRSTSGITRDTVVRDALLAAPLNSHIVCLDADTTAQEATDSDHRRAGGQQGRLRLSDHRAPEEGALHRPDAAPRVRRLDACPQNHALAAQRCPSYRQD